jgi:hypothetical protein
VTGDDVATDPGSAAAEVQVKRLFSAVSGGDEAASTRVLVVDDDEIIHVIVEEMLPGCQVQGARSAAEALQLQRETGAADVALVDKQLPDRSDLALIAELRREWPETEVIVITAHASVDSALEAMELGAMDYLRKPFSGDELALKVRNARDKSRLQRELRESEARHRQVFETSADAILMYDAETGRIEAANGAATVLYGHPRERLVGMVVHELRADPAAVPALAAEVAERLGDRNELRLDRRSDGSVFPAEVSIGRAAAGQSRVVEVVRDVGDVLRARREQQQLEQQVQMSQKLEALGQLAGGIAHDFNNLLLAFSSYTGFLRDFLESVDRGDLAPALEDVAKLEHVNRTASQLTRQLLAFSRRQIASPELLAVDEVVDSVGHLLRRTLEADIALEIGLGAGCATVYIDRGQLEQVLINLILNARDAMPRGGVIGLRTASIEDGDERWVEIAVSDTGTGMGPDVLPRIFDPFFTTKGAGRGTGLGLPTVQNILAQARGEIRVSSTPGKGSVFSVLLPAAGVVQAPGAAPPRPVVGRGRGEHILLVEDDLLVRQSLRRLLCNAGYQVSDAGSGPQALELARSAARHFDLLLTDAVMPSMSGQLLAEALRRTQAQVKVVFMSAYAAEAVAARAGISRASPFLAKPFSEGKLLAVVRAVLDGEPTSLAS